METANQKPTILANNWDRFGGRALDILNGYVLSIKLECNFAFYWPMDHRFPEMKDQLKFFSQDFIDKHMIDSSPDVGVIHPIDFNRFNLVDAQKHLGEYEVPQFFKNPDFFSLPKFLDEDLFLARKFYAEAAETVMSDSVMLLWDKLRLKYSESVAVHGRYGDLITGSFNQYVDTGKYIDTFSLKELVEKLIKENNQVVILSDTPLITKALERLTDSELMPMETNLSETESMTNFQLQTIELLILASSKFIYAPSSSAFSILASRLGNVPIKYIREETSEVLFSRPWSRKRWRFYNRFDKSIRDKVRARDILSLIQFYWKSLDYKRIKSLLNKAHESDGDYVLSLCCQAILAKINMKTKDSMALIAKAEYFARSRRDIHHDPLILVLLVKFNLVQGDSPEHGESIREEILNLYPYQFLKQKALNYISLTPVTEAELYLPGSKRTSIRAMWNKIVKGEQEEIIYALLQLLQMKHEATNVTKKLK